MGKKRYFIGVDLGDRRDHTAIAVLERRDGMEGREYRLRYLRRLGLGSGYEAAVEAVRRVVIKVEREGSCEVVVDGTGVGAGVVEMLKRACGPVTSVVITGGTGAREGHGCWLTPKKDLLGELAVMLEGRELRAASGMRERGQLERELMGMRMGRGGREHDDLVMAVALACWRARRRGVWGAQRGSLGL